MALQVVLVNDLAAETPLESKKWLEEVTIAGPDVAGHVEADQHGVGHQLQDGERAQEVSIQAKNREASEGGKGSGSDGGDVVVVQIELLQAGEAGELVAVEQLDLVVLEVENPDVGESLQAEVGHQPDHRAVEEDAAYPAPADEARVDQLGHVVAVEEDLGGVHGDESGHVVVAAVGADDRVHRPAGVVETTTTLGALRDRGLRFGLDRDLQQSYNDQRF